MRIGSIRDQGIATSHHAFREVRVAIQRPDNGDAWPKLSSQFAQQMAVGVWYRLAYCRAVRCDKQSVELSCCGNTRDHLSHQGLERAVRDCARRRCPKCDERNCQGRIIFSDTSEEATDFVMTFRQLLANRFTLQK